MKHRFDPEFLKSYLSVGDFLANFLIEPTVLAYLEKLPLESKIGVAISGGADSLALALWLYCVYPALRSRVFWLHFNHHLRGEASDNEERYVIQVAHSLNVTVFVGHGEGAQERKISEAVLRDERYAFFQRVAQEEGWQAILLGHHADDVAETMLMRWMRGSGAAGLSSPKPIRREGSLTYLRPFLKIEKNFLINLLNGLQIPYAEDHTNGLPLFFRNRVRAVLEDLKATLPKGAKWNVGYTRERLEEENEALEQILDEILVQNKLKKGMVSWEWKTLDSLPKNLQRRALYVFLEGLQIVLESKSFERCLGDLILGKNFHQNFNVGRLIFQDGILECVYNSINEQTIWPLTPLLTNGCVVLPNGDEVALEIDHDALLNSTSSFPAMLFVRNRRPGDRYCLEGGVGSKKLSDIFINLKIDYFLRDSLPIVCGFDSSILWVPGLKDQAAIQKKYLLSSALRLTYRMEMATIKM